ncbi:macro domain-containing protein XCC3184-like [Impatiens glandulifera]|uniref:macro domain-containing protein XCC3184-like n=1 Tax=Impatiens glandulifera TaxID=253017 RepID=UPI001FB08ACA|nr:macro domain-containing protein XCC3184-like [Impatiens glandulifera]
MLGGAGADGAIHKAAGPELRAACYKHKEVRAGIRCPVGEARITRGFKLAASHVIHTVGPVHFIHPNPEASLRNAYRNTLQIAKQNNIHYIAFPAISCGVHRYPYDEAATVAITTIKEFSNDFKEVHFVLFSDDIYNVWLSKAKDMLQHH